jgi:hypothetical protein
MPQSWHPNPPQAATLALELALEAVTWPSSSSFFFSS